MTQQGVRITGICKSWDKGFGFITRDDGLGDVFVHYTEISKKGFKSLKVGDALEFQVELRSDGNTRAVRVTGIGGGEVILHSEDQGILCGTCKEWNIEKGFGLVTRADGKGDVFVHQSEVRKKGFRSLKLGEFVWFKMNRKDDGSTHAIDVKVSNNTECAAQNIVINPNQTLTGTCKVWNLGFGFIRRDDGGPDVFVHQTQLQKTGFRSLTPGEKVWFKVEIKADGNIRAVNVTTKEPMLNVLIPKTEYTNPPPEMFAFHPQQLQLNQNQINYKPEQLPFHPMVPEGNFDNWRKMMQWAQPGFCSGYIAQSYQNKGNYWAGICLSTVAKKST